MSQHSRSSPHSVALAALIACPSLLLPGCQSAMSTSPTSAGLPASSVSDHASVQWPLRFRKHNLGIHCFDTYGCRVSYDGRLQVDEDPQVLQPSSASYGPDYQKNWIGGRLGFHNFPPPAEVSWRSKDGQPHQADIDIGAIFKDELVRHRVPREEIPADATFGDPDIVLEINDRTINVYMRAFVPTSTLQIPGNRYSNARDDLILVNTQTF